MIMGEPARADKSAMGAINRPLHCDGDQHMVEDARKNPRLIGGVYQVGQVITNSPTLTTYTAYNRNTSDVVGLQVFELPPTVEVEAALRLLEPLERRRLVQSPHVIHVFDWG